MLWYRPIGASLSISGDQRVSATACCFADEGVVTQNLCGSSSASRLWILSSIFTTITVTCPICQQAICGCCKINAPIWRGAALWFCTLQHRTLHVVTRGTGAGWPDTEYSPCCSRYRIFAAPLLTLNICYATGIAPVIIILEHWVASRCCRSCHWHSLCNNNTRASSCVAPLPLLLLA